MFCPQLYNVFFIVSRSLETRLQEILTWALYQRNKCFVRSFIHLGWDSRCFDGYAQVSSCP